jgi:tRNA pseudouridine38-40 synthase
VKVDKRKRNEEEQERKRQRIEQGKELPSPFSKEEIEAESRKPKRKVAVLIGYAGSGYKGMQIQGDEKTIEGDIFKAFIAAGAISKANADDPKKSSLIRCARTDKGVHAAGNVISLKLIVEDEDIVEKINANLPPQLRVWGYERTPAGFSCYQVCDSRWYEYLIPTHAFLPPHPQSFLGKKLIEHAEAEGKLDEYKARQEDVANFWAETEENYIKPILEKLDPQLRAAVTTAMHTFDDGFPEGASDPTDAVDVKAEEVTSEVLPDADEVKKELVDLNLPVAPTATDGEAKPEEKGPRTLSPLEAAIKEVKAAYLAAKKAYRISDSRKARVQEALDQYKGTNNYHNYTVQKNFKEDSAKRYIMSFQVGAKPIIVNDTEWLSLKVHGQSFMMHQIRKMVAMATLVVRCGTPLERIKESYGDVNISIPKVPGLGLLLERPVFQAYNKRATTELGREPIDFAKYEDKIEEFKHREIYERIYREEEAQNQYVPASLLPISVKLETY